MNVPNGLSEIKQTFGDITKYIRQDGTLSHDWENDQLATVALPFSMALSWDHSISVNKIRCHRLLVGTLHGIFQEVQNQDLVSTIQTYGGCFAFRPQRASAKLSTHAWGIALDLDPETNQQGTQGDIDSRLVQLFTDAGFEWGGTWVGARRDSMHFQFATGY